MLYKFEKYYLSLARYKIFLFIKDILDDSAGRTLVIIGGTLAIISLAFFAIIYSFIGVNAFLEKVHLEKYRIEKIPIMKSEFDLRPYFNK